MEHQMTEAVTLTNEELAILVRYRGRMERETFRKSEFGARLRTFPGLNLGSLVEDGLHGEYR